MLKKRVVTALVGLPFIIAAIWFGEPWFSLILIPWGLMAVYEFYRLVTTTGVAPLTWFGLIGTLFLLISPQFDFSFPIVPILLAAAVVLPPIWLWLRRPGQKPFASWLWTTGGILYLGWLLSHLVALRGLGDGRNWAFLALLVIFASDTGAFFVGRALGRHRLAPSISPGKTREGAIGGLVSAVITSLYFTLPTPLYLPLGIGQAILLGLLISIFGQAGDLLESLFKRRMGAKESSQLIPGHGGFLDRIDSVVFAGIVVYYYVLWVAT